MKASLAEAFFVLGLLFLSKSNNANQKICCGYQTQGFGYDIDSDKP
jgi:hypothetical protein